jgi:group I intron endonuclease
MIGLYAIQNTHTQQAYVGSSNDIKRRIKEHKTDLKKARHHCAYLQNSWNKHGSASFEIKQIAHADSHAIAKELEQAFLDCFFHDLYNTNPQAVGAASGEFSAAKRPDWHMKTVMQRLSAEERKAIYGKTKGTKRDPAPYIASAAKRIANPDFAKRLSEACKGQRQVVECPHCGLHGGGGNMRRYHFDKCAKK